MKSERMRRIDELLQRELGVLCERKVVSELNCLLTITGVKTSPDLRHAQVYFSVFGPNADWQQVRKCLDKHRVELQAAVGHNVQMKYTPVLHFRPDHTLEQADHVMNIINDLGIDSDVPMESADDSDTEE
jgi:ribosome-binding factor A